jgi:hypothetical protein
MVIFLLLRILPNQFRTKIGMQNLGGSRGGRGGGGRSGVARGKAMQAQILYGRFFCESCPTSFPPRSRFKISVVRQHSALSASELSGFRKSGGSPHSLHNQRFKRGAMSCKIKPGPLPPIAYRVEPVLLDDLLQADPGDTQPVHLGSRISIVDCARKDITTVQSCGEDITNVIFRRSGLSTAVDKGYMKTR